MMKRIIPEMLRQQFAALTAAYPEIAEDEILRADMFEGETHLNDALRAIERIRREAREFGDVVNNEISDLESRRNRYRRRDEAMRALMLRIMQWADLTKLDIKIATISVRKGAPRVVITDERAVPDAFCRIIRDPDRTKIREALNAFEDVPGASLSNAEPVLTVRIK